MQQLTEKRLLGELSRPPRRVRDDGRQDAQYGTVTAAYPGAYRLSRLPCGVVEAPAREPAASYWGRPLADGNCLLFHDRAAEEVGIHGGPQFDGVVEDEVAELLLVDMAVLDELVGLGHDAAHVGHVPVADVRSEDGGEGHSAGIELRRERQRVHRVVGLAAEEEAVREHVEQVVDTGEQGLTELVDVAGQLVGSTTASSRPSASRSTRPATSGRAVLVEQLAQQIGVEAGRVVLLDGVDVALLPVADDAGE